MADFGRLKIINKQATSWFPLAAPRIVVGRTLETTHGVPTGCDVALNHATVSNPHAAFTVEGGVCYVEDLRSSNGTRVDGTLLRKPTKDSASWECPKVELVSGVSTVEFWLTQDGAEVMRLIWFSPAAVAASKDDDDQTEPLRRCSTRAAALHGVFKSIDTDGHGSIDASEVPCPPPTSRTCVHPMINHRH